MAGSAQGWHESSYLDVSTPLAELGPAAVRVPGMSREVRILPGLMQRDPPDVMRGEETQLVGLLDDQSISTARYVCRARTAYGFAYVRVGWNASPLA